MNLALFLGIWPQITCWSQPVLCGLLLDEFLPGQLDKSCKDKYSACSYYNWTGAGSANFSPKCTSLLGFSVILLVSLFWRSWRSWLYKYPYWYISCIWEVNWNTGCPIETQSGRTTYSFAGKCDGWTMLLRRFLKDSVKWKSLAYQVIAYKYYLFPNQKRKGIIELIFTSASSLLLFPFSHPNTHIIKPQNLFLPTSKINKLLNL